MWWLPFMPREILAHAGTLRGGVDASRLAEQGVPPDRQEEAPASGGRIKDEGKNQEPKGLQIRTKEFALQVIRMYSALPKLTEAQVLGKQVLRSSTSIGANYREVNRARSKPKFIAKIGDCHKELDETAYWLDLLAESSIVPNAKLADLRDECDQLMAIFTTISKKTKNNTS
jgi:four helix bundle protein